MEKTILIVEDEFVVANDLRLILQKSGYKVCGIADSVAEALVIINKHAPALVLLDIYLKGSQTGIDLAKYLAEKNIAFVYLSANNNQTVMEAATATHPYGFLVKPFREKDVLIALEIAHFRHSHSIEAKLRKEQVLQISLTNLMVDNIPWDERWLKIASTLQQAIPFDYIILGLKKPNEDCSRTSTFFRIGFDSYQTIRFPEFFEITGTTAKDFESMCDRQVSKGAQILNGVDFKAECIKTPTFHLIAKKFQLQSNFIMPLRMARDGGFIFSFYSRRADAYTSDHLDLFKRLQPFLQITIDRLMAYDEIKKLSEQLQQGSNDIKNELSVNLKFEEIIGSSHSLLHVFDQVMQVAALDTSVLLLGESGTGKELVARAIHNLSPREKKLMVKINCAALPANLIESELFGHEKGAFTGALDKRIGKFELAHGGTIFLDEIGDMPLDLQVKLLRVLQEKEIERIGGKQTIKTDVRVIAATNRHLEKEIAEGRFRLDLYYRLNVFPIMLPPLRERKEDIKMLVNFFAQKFSKKTGKPYYGVLPASMDELMQYSWPGNVREMENIMEQAFILNDGKSQLKLGRPLVNTSSPAEQSTKADASPKTLEDVKKLQKASEKDYILSILKKTNGRIRGVGGAAELLKLKPTTLESRIEKLGIKNTHSTNYDHSE